MIVMRYAHFTFVACAALLAGMAGSAFGITVEELRSLLDRKQAVTLVDMRRNPLYAAGHIPGAINIPYRMCATTRLPLSGRVVTYGDGVDAEAAKAGAEGLRQRGISAEILEGGFLAWEELHLAHTGTKGVSQERFHYLTYGELVQASAANKDLVLVDLRAKVGEPVPGAAAMVVTGKSESGGSDDLGEKFADVRKLSLRPERGRPVNHRDAMGKLQGEKRARGHQLYVLIDDSDGLSEKIARQLRAAGIRRIAILAGGDKALKRGGEPGLRTITR